MNEYLIGGIAWYLVGMGIVLTAWYLDGTDMKMRDAIFIIFISLLGPVILAAFIEYVNERYGGKVLIKRKKN